jgi:hypothetical protein
MGSKKDNETRGPFVVDGMDVYITNGIIDFSLSSADALEMSWLDLEGKISAKMADLGAEITKLSKLRTQLGGALRAGDSREPVEQLEKEENSDEDSTGICQ